LGLIRKKLAATQSSAITMTIQAMNPEKLLQLLSVLISFWLQILHRQAWAVRGRKFLSRVQATAV
jgi:hypothetical protein